MCLQGWLDITYLDPKGDFRLSRGNKGTLFVLTRDEPAKARLLAALGLRSSNAEVISNGCKQVMSLAAASPGIPCWCSQLGDQPGRRSPAAIMCVPALAGHPGGMQDVRVVSLCAGV